MNELSLSDRVAKKDQVVCRLIEDELILLNLDNSHYYSAKEVGVRIWELCDGNRDIKDIIDMICNEYDINEAEAASDVKEFIGDLSREGLVVLLE